MKKLSYLLYLIGAIQIILGLFHLFAPAFFLQQTGHSIPEADIYYPLAMLCRKVLGGGAVFLYIAKDPAKHLLWIKAMIMIQLVDLGAGIFYTAIDVIPLADSAFPMFNAIWIAGLLALWLPKSPRS